MRLLKDYLELLALTLVSCIIGGAVFATLIKLHGGNALIKSNISIFSEGVAFTFIVASVCFVLARAADWCFNQKNVSPPNKEA